MDEAAPQQEFRLIMQIHRRWPRLAGVCRIMRNAATMICKEAVAPVTGATAFVI